MNYFTRVLTVLTCIWLWHIFSLNDNWPNESIFLSTPKKKCSHIQQHIARPTKRWLRMICRKRWKNRESFEISLLLFFVLPSINPFHRVFSSISSSAPFFQFCNKFRVGEKCCEFECLDPPGENNKYEVSQSRASRSANEIKDISTLKCVYAFMSFLSLCLIDQERKRKKDRILAGLGHQPALKPSTCSVIIVSLGIILFSPLLRHFQLLQ